MMRGSWQLTQVLKVLLFQTALNVNRVVIGAREDRVNGILGESVLLRIEQTSGTPVRKITWEKGSRAFLTCEMNRCKVYTRQKTRVQCFPDCSLKLSGLLGDDSGMYEAKLISANGGVETQIIYLDVLVPVSLPTITVRRDNSSIHHSLTLTCNITGGSLPQYFWEKDAQQLPGSPRHTLINGNSSISIHNFTNADCGTYTCTVRNSISKHRSQRTLFGEDSLECATSGYLLTIIAAATCLVGLVLIILLFNKRTACKTGIRIWLSRISGKKEEQQIVNERTCFDVSKEDGGGQYIFICFPESVQRTERIQPQNGLVDFSSRPQSFPLYARLRERIFAEKAKHRDRK
ncbi:carcinoembryonic antigen-related cell adhesion molecule 1-like [Pristis pectinata]|uniref:carcinoembryonic antigen-related cell adhesion molecule 1-like n=1 Tax=Pristis pectinata TaxID=685728 RepID=UPI00223CEE77|nr:carcinoembryonic antigen-related cell adhesion molecule 1-like [Pristis pectinata]